MPIDADLERYVRQLAKLSALALHWQDLEPRGVIRTMLGLIIDTLDVELAHAVVRVPGMDVPVETGLRRRSSPEEDSAIDVADLASVVQDMHRAKRVREQIRLSCGVRLHITSFPFWNGEGTLALGTVRDSFPTEVEASILGAALNHLVHRLRGLRPTISERRPRQIQTEAPREGAPLEDLVDELPAGPDDALEFGDVVGKSAALRDILAHVNLVAPTDATVIIFGESGTGKELIAREIHARSLRAGRNLIKVNCSAIPREMFETEFFGHVKGAFTGAVRDRPGRFKLADKGTLFLDEVGDMPLELQPKLLRVLQEGQFERVGDDTTQTIDVRIIAATNRDLAAEVAAGRFRADLYYRLTAFPLRVPPLRDRRDDIAPLAAHFIERTARSLGAPPPRLSAAHIASLQSYDWPGNARELQNVIERAVILGRPGHLRLDQVMGDRGEPPPPPSSLPSPQSAQPLDIDEVISEDEWRRRERDNLAAALRRTGGRIYGQSGAAQLLGIKPSTLQSRLRAFGLNPRDFAPSFR